MKPTPWWTAFLLSLSQFLREEAQRQSGEIKRIAK